ncbi:uncharacterized protein LOC132731473 isoform X2 [Ruditapes philippinarum]|nr:uncharacterized protein LOC132731473 isoform X2 [Ruditapes philippinarum]XP_060573665.1 uncharacterized protein LOC132731473 isoform X2 [Ruditapes philippinarum]
MMLFRESMRGTCGENVYRCWKDLEEWKRTEDPVQKMYREYAIKNHYINESSTTRVAGNIKVKALYGILKFDLVPENEIQQKIMESVTDTTFHAMIELDTALLKLQTILLNALKFYWLPRHLLHTLKVVNKEGLDILKRPAPVDKESLEHARRLRCRYKFPTIYQNSRISSPASTVLVSRSAGDFSSLSDEDVERMAETKIDPADLLSLWGGPVKFPPLRTPSPFRPDIICSENGSGDQKQLPTAVINRDAFKSPPNVLLSSYLGGKARTEIGNLPETGNWMVWCLGSDTLACCPFRTFLERNNQHQHLQYLGFWTDIRKYLDTDDHVTNGYGQPMRQMLVNRIIGKYLSGDEGKRAVFTKKLNNSLLHALRSSNNVSTLCEAQEKVQDYLWEPLQMFLQEERHQFLKQIHGHSNRLPQETNQMAGTAMLRSARNVMNADSMLSFNWGTKYVETEPLSSLSPFSPTSSINPSTLTPPRPSTTDHVSITEEQKQKAMEMAILCCEYGVSMMVPEKIPSLSRLVAVLHSDYGSLHLTREATVRHDGLRSLQNKEKINIKTIKVSRKVLDDTIDISKLQNGNLMRRRAGVRLERPKKPKSLMEVFSIPAQFDFFKRFMLLQKMSLPVVFWRAVEDLQEVSDRKTTQIKVTKIMRKFFGKNAKYGAGLDCDEEIIRQIPNMEKEKVSPGILICAQAAVFRSLEIKWFPIYCASFPPESECSSQSSPKGIQEMLKNFEEAATTAKKVKKQMDEKTKTIKLWKRYSRNLVEFKKAMTDKTMSQLFGMFLKYEVEKEKLSSNQELAAQLAPPEKNTMMPTGSSNFQTRVVIRERPVIMNRLPSDLKFWIEIMKYQNLVDSMLKKVNLSIMESEFLIDKARSIVSCFLASEILPRVQVNVPNEMALDIVSSLASDGPRRGLFHDAVVHLFPIIYHFYRRFSNEWMKGGIPDEFFDNIEHVIWGNVGTTPHKRLNVCDFRNLTPSQINKLYHQSADDFSLKIQFSLSTGVVMTYPQEKKSSTDERKKKSTHELKTNFSMVKANKGGRGDRKDNKQPVEEGDKDDTKNESDKIKSTGNVKDKHKAEKIVVKDAKQVSGDSCNAENAPLDKARKLSLFIESLNRGKESKIKKQNNMFSHVMPFRQVTAVVAQSSDIGSEHASSN